ncbi:hypothetical protein SLS56_007228 [Neofusicoccum ribis]|uniref:Carrier domain-containing protein n=1 Tax=Neofusicoccum ribis TaxID=45134 RepID=A0ABR3SNF7_9PEZI
MVLKDKTYETTSLEDYHTVISSKVRGTWNLHEASLQTAAPLDFFTLLSSISGLVGKKGQANYAAANTFLDAFSAYRNAQGLPANAVNLGVIEDVGYIFEQGGADKGLQEFFLLQRSGAEPSAVLRSAVEVVNGRFMKILALDEPLEPGKSLAAYGLDSLSAVEFRNWLRADVGAELTMLEITNASSLFGLCEKIIAKMSAR